MTLDFDRYLSYTGSQDHEIQKQAYTEWGSYCYQAYGRCGGGSGGGEAASSAASLSQATSLPIHQYILNTSNNYSSTSCAQELQRQQHLVGPYCPGGYYGYSVSTPDLSDPDDSMPRPPGQAFGSRLAWNGTGKSQSLPVCADGPLRRRKSPALGINGLKLGGVSGRGEECLTRRSLTTKFARTSITTSMTSCHKSNGRVESLNVDNKITSQSSQTYDSENNMVTATSVKTVSTASSSIVLAPVADDVIEEGSSEDEIIPDDEIPEVPRSRRISFADEHGESLVRCRLFERDSCDEDESEQSEEEEPESDQEKVSDSDDGSTPKRKRFTVLADEAYQNMVKDLQNVKRLLRQNREFFQSLSPQNEGDVNGNKSLPSPTGSDEDECVVFPCTLANMETTTLLSSRDGTRSPETPFTNQSIPIPEVCDEEDDVTHGLTNQEESSISQTEDHINRQIVEICDLMIHDHTCDCIELDLKALRIAKYTIECKFRNFKIPQDPKITTNLPLETLDFVEETRVINGSIKASECCHGKDIFVRWSSDKWRTFTDILCSKPEAETDIYEFTIPLPVSLLSNEPGLRGALEFAAFCEDQKAGCRHWNNNEHHNFVIEVHSREETES